MLSSYYTVRGFGQYTSFVKKSRFIASVGRVENEEAAQAFIEKIKKEHNNANHNCSAYMIGMHDEIQKASDDGEPSGTAGVPMLEVLKKRELKDTIVVVTRYFGGIKLGAGGLIRAYGGAATEGLDATGIVRCEPMQITKITFDYTWLGKLENELRSAGYTINDTHYLDQAGMDILVPIDQTAPFKEWITNLTNGQAQIEERETRYVEKEI
ncbi:MAG TPA: YigZ family protein [Bacillales bacterium]|nr:YigZ family protein [Bacillales bacterium]